MTKLIVGSLGAIAKRDGLSLAESFVNCDVCVLVDVSASMNTHDAHDSQTRYDVACTELAHLQNNNPGRIAVLAFSDNTVFCPSGIPVGLFQNTDLAGALTFARFADTGDVRFVVISDGEPDDKAAALHVARQFRGRIDVVYTGPEDKPAGRDFLTRLAQTCGGVTVTAERAHELAAVTQQLLLSM